MLTILLNWVYAVFTITLLGFGVAALIEKIFSYRIKSGDSILMAGMITATVYAQSFSLFYKVGMLANIILVVVCALILLFCWKYINSTVKAWIKDTSAVQKVILLLLVLAWSYFTSRGYIHYDSDLYHAQSIRWMEEYGIVPGLGNLHERFAYNSSFFALSALYSLKFLLGYSMHAMSGLVAIILSITCLPIMKSWKRKSFSLADFARVGAIYYLTTITNEVVSPASDYAVMCIIFFIVIKWLDALEKNVKEIAPYALLCVVGVYALTLKLTAGLILLLLIKPAYQLIKEKRVKEIFIYLALGLLVAIPWMARTVIISGWLFYPFTALDLFNFDWEMDGHMINLDAMQIKVWGRALYNVTLIDVPLIGWFPNWFFNTLSTMEKLLIIGDFVAIIITVLKVVEIFIKKSWEKLDVLLVLITMICCYVFWQTSAPLMRYGYAYVLLLVFLVFGWVLQEILTSKYITGSLLGKKFAKSCAATVYLMFLLYGCYKIVVLADYIKDTSYADFYVWQEDYGVYEMDSYELNGVTFYYPVYGDRAGYEYFPSAGAKVEGLEFRGETIEEGFIKKLD